MATRVSYPVEIKAKAIEMRIAGIPVKEVMEQLKIRNETQVKTWMRWYRSGELNRLEQPVGKQYSYGKGPELYRLPLLPQSRPAPPTSVEVQGFTYCHAAPQEQRVLSC